MYVYTFVYDSNKINKYSQSVHAPASHAGLMDNEAER